MTKQDVKQQQEPIQLTYFERLAAIRAYNSQSKAEFSRAEMIDHIIAAINEERAAAVVGR